MVWVSEESKFHITQRNDLPSGPYGYASRGYGGIRIAMG